MAATAIDLLTSEREDDEPLLDEVLSYEDAGLLTRDHGVVLRFRDGGEFQLTRAQELQREREGYLALEMTAAERFDFGTPADYLESLARFAQSSR